MTKIPTLDVDGKLDSSVLPVDAASDVGALAVANNLSDVANAATARANLGATTTGAAVFTAASATAARTAIGAGTSDLALGTTSSTAKAGNYQPTSAGISDATTAGKAALTATVVAYGATQADARAAIGAGTSDLALGTTSTTALPGDTPIPSTASDVGAVANASGQTLTLWSGSSAAYAALTPDSNTVYVVTS